MKDNDNSLKFRELLQFVFENKQSDFYRRKYEKYLFSAKKNCLVSILSSFYLSEKRRLMEFLQPLAQLVSQ